MDKFDDKMNKKMNRLLRFTLFSTYFFRMFAPLVFIGVVCLIIGIFKSVFFIIGGAFLLLDLVLSIICIVHFDKVQSNNPEYERFRRAMSGLDPYTALNKLTNEWAGSEFFRSRLELYSEEAASNKTVRDAFELYKEHAGCFLNESFFFEFSAKTEVYRGDNKEHFIITFDRQREVNDDVIVHMWYDLIYDKGTKSDAINETILCEDYLKIDEYFDKVEAFLTDNDLMDLPVKETDIDTDE